MPNSAAVLHASSLPKPFGPPCERIHTPAMFAATRRLGGHRLAWRCSNPFSARHSDILVASLRFSTWVAASRACRDNLKSGYMLFRQVISWSGDIVETSRLTA